MAGRDDRDRTLGLTEDGGWGVLYSTEERTQDEEGSRSPERRRRDRHNPQDRTEDWRVTDGANDTEQGPLRHYRGGTCRPTLHVQGRGCSATELPPDKRPLRPLRAHRRLCGTLDLPWNFVFDSVT